MDIDVEQQGVVRRIAEALEESGVVTGRREGALQSELDYWRLHRYATIVVRAVWPERGDVRPVDLLRAVREGMQEDLQLAATIAGWWDTRAEEIREAEEILARSVRPGEPPDPQRADDVRGVVAGEMSMEEFRRRASRWPEQTRGEG